MAKPNRDPAIEAHLEWLGFVRPTGLVVSATALSQAGALLPRGREDQRALRSALASQLTTGNLGGASLVSESAPTAIDLDPDQARISDFPAFAQAVFGWDLSPDFFAGVPGAAIPAELELDLPAHGETLRPDLAVREPSLKDGAPGFQLLIQVLPPGANPDEPPRAGSGRLEASPASRLERLLRHTGVPAGLLIGDQTLRLVSAPQVESSGWIDFHLPDLLRPAGYPIAAALRLLLGQERLLTLPSNQRLPALLAQSRQFQNQVSVELAAQVLHALYELLRGLQAADDHAEHALLADYQGERADEVYHALLTVVLRLVFLLYAEERGLLPEGETFARHYSLLGLYQRLVEDQALYPDTMDQRYGAWAQLLVLFRLVHDGAAAPGIALPPRHGVLFDPNRYPFLEGRHGPGVRQVGERLDPPKIPDGTIHRALEKLLVLNGERLSYRALDVEQIGSVYETMMGFRLERATGPSLAIKAKKPHGAPTTIDLEALLAQPGKARAKWLKAQTEREPTKTQAPGIQAATTLEALHAALEPLVDRAATPDLARPGALVLQPSEERRKSGSHYTPRALTEPIVRRTLAPLLARLSPAGAPPSPAALLDLKLCDPAMGSGAFLVEACRQLGDALVESWRFHRATPPIPADEDERIFAMRQVAQRCLYGVDRNPVAVDLAKVSLWLATLAKDHALTFIDHALRHGDSLVGLNLDQIRAFHWETAKVETDAFAPASALDQVLGLRQQIQNAADQTDDSHQRALHQDAEAALADARTIGDLAILAYFSESKPKARLERRQAFLSDIQADRLPAHRSHLEHLRHSSPPLAPFHWPLEYPEVFTRKNPGFDAFIGNPPFLGGRNLSATQGEVYSSWLLYSNKESSGGADLVAHFFRRAFDLLRTGGALGLIATNSLSQGDTRESGLRWICTHGGEIYHADRRITWPGQAAVIISVVHLHKGPYSGTRLLDDRPVDLITAYLFHQGSHESPKRLPENAGKSFVGCYILGMGFTFDDDDKKGIATPVAEMHRLIAKDPRNQEVIFPYIGGEEVNQSPTHAHERYVINFGELDESECRRLYPDLFAIVEAKVKPERIDKDAKKYPRMVHEWWKFWNARPELQAATTHLTRVLVVARVSNTLGFTFLPSTVIFNEKIVIFPVDSMGAFGLLQSSIHEAWARFFSSSLKDDLQYTPSDCFETFPFPPKWEQNETLEHAGRTYYEHRAQLMQAHNEGLTTTYNRFHDPDEQSAAILNLRHLHAQLDQAVLTAYGWPDLTPTYTFELDHDDPTPEDSPTPKRQKRKPYRYRLPTPLRDTLLARLLTLNESRAQNAISPKTTPVQKKSARRASQSPQLFD